MAVFVDQERLLQAIARSIHKRILPDLASGSAQFSARCAFEMTAHLLHRSATGESSLNRLDATSMAEEVRHLTSGDLQSADAERLIQILHEDSDFYRQDYAKYRASLDNYSKIEDSDFPPPTQEELTRILQRHFDDSNAEAQIIDLGVGGYSKQTILFDYLSKGRVVAELVMRRDLPFAAQDRSSVIDEFHILKAVFQAGLPVAEPLFVEADSTVLVSPYLLSKRMPGKLIGDSLGLHEKVDFDVEKELGILLAKLHAIDLGALQLPGFSDVKYDLHCQQQRIREFTDIYRAHVEVPSAALEIGLKWLYANSHLVVNQRSIVHGDVGYNNILFDGDKLIALLDWELVHVGSPTEDLAYVLSVIENPDSFLAAYSAAGGPPVSDAALTYSRIFGNLRNAIYGTVSMRQFNDGKHEDVSVLPIVLSSYSNYVSALDETLSSVIKKHGFVWEPEQAR